MNALICFLLGHRYACKLRMRRNGQGMYVMSEMLECERCGSAPPKPTI